MNKNNVNSEAKKNIEKTLKSISSRKDTPRYVFFILIFLYVIASLIVSIASNSAKVIVINGRPLPVSAFSGVFSSLANICIIILVIFFKKTGFITSITLLVLQAPFLIKGIINAQTLAPIQGLFTGILTITALITIYINNVRIGKFQERMREQAVTDGLTGLSNRFACSEVVNDLVKRKIKFVLVSVDINNFKSINDTMGHEVGNKVLIEIGDRWKKAAEAGLSGTFDFITRQGGDEFAIIIRGHRSPEDIIKTIKYYENILEQRITVDECDFFLYASFGYAEYPVDADNSDTLFTYADAAMYEIKNTAASEHIFRFTPELLKKEHILEIERKIRTALDNDNVFFMLQPQFDISHRLRGFEALARMRDTDGSMISPADFIPIAEKVGLIDKIDLSVFRNSARFFGELIKDTGMDITLSINVSVRHLMKNGFIDEVKSVLNSCGLSAAHLEIEITESIMIDSAEKALQCINEIREMGIKIAIDDFGTGYSSLSYLNNFPADLLKVDKSFIDKMNSSESSRQYVSAIISIGHIMNFDVISEGVEEDEQLETLRSIGCDYIQGFIWGRPMLPEDAEELVRAQTEQ